MPECNRQLDRETEPSWYPDPQACSLFLEFMLRFSRLEYALKRDNDYASKHKGHLEANWEKFKNDLAKERVPPCALAALCYLQNTPPKKQVNNTGDEDKDWRKIDWCCDWSLLINSLKTVRNNVFHGGKAQCDPVRDDKLLCHCLFIMDAILEVAPPKIKQAYENHSS